MIKNLALRWADADDHQAIVILLNEMHAEIGSFPLCSQKLTAHVGEVLASGKALLAGIDGELVLTLYAAKGQQKKTKLFERYGDKIMRGYQFTDVGGEYMVQ